MGWRDKLLTLTLTLTALLVSLNCLIELYVLVTYKTNLYISFKQNYFPFQTENTIRLLQSPSSPGLYFLHSGEHHGGQI